ncbi:hypothetical protein FDP41_009128 [Naegleria fowleri]|uniref:O-acyltransferase WSD1 C-terminal domain-containing protein n=2 Tax=Naegleria fowleri TaxID=5763 RepID=A0A6A5BIL2_NAEFO|nr:uncharacterized protein FDP41_009128 [Naegleria fowleri]KAF0972879.1 hypothetical protein FDP41_009128 [Naegleria fowleri]
MSEPINVESSPPPLTSIHIHHATPRRRLSKFGQLMLMQEQPDEPLVVGGLVLLGRTSLGSLNHDDRNDCKFNRKAFEERLSERLLARFVRFRSLVVSECEYIDVGVENVCMENHVKYCKLSEEKFQRMSEDEILSEMLSEIFTTPFVPVRYVTGSKMPLWQCYVIENYSRGIVLFFKIHHWIGDGTLLQKIIVGDLLDNEEQVTNFLLNKYDKMLQGSHNNWNSALSIIHNVEIVISRNVPFVGKLLALVVGFLLKFLAFFSTLLLVLYLGISGDSDTMFKPSSKNPKVGKVSCSFIWFNESNEKHDADMTHETDKYFTVEEFKRVALLLSQNNSNTGKVNDLFLTIFSGVIDRYRLKMSSDREPRNNLSREYILKSCTSRLGMGVNIRTSKSREEAGNIVGVLFGTLPFDIHLKLRERFSIIHKYMNLAKFLPQPYFNRYLLWLATALLPKSLAVSLLNWGASSSTFTISNVQGLHSPEDEISFKLLGHDLIQGVGFIPLVKPIGVNSTLMSFNGRVGISVVCDKGIIPNAHEVTDCIREEYLAIRKELGI